VAECSKRLTTRRFPNRTARTPPLATHDDCNSERKTQIERALHFLHLFSDGYCESTQGAPLAPPGMRGWCWASREHRRRHRPMRQGDAPYMRRQCDVCVGECKGGARSYSSWACWAATWRCEPLALSIVAHRFCGPANFAKPKGRGLGDLVISAV
jgi:hypothetical protein